LQRARPETVRKVWVLSSALWTRPLLVGRSNSNAATAISRQSWRNGITNFRGFSRSLSSFCLRLDPRERFLAPQLVHVATALYILL
jgi:hypothetical protein